jgi:RNA polymerase sigma-70 factor (ECF subfamily)
MATRPNRLRLVGTEAPAAEAPVAEHGQVDLDRAFRLYSRYVAYISLRILGRPDDVDDVVQQVFLDAQRGLKGIRDAQAVKGWLATLAVRKSVKKLRRRRLRRFFGVDEDFDYGKVAQEQANPETRTLVAEIYRVLDELPAEQRSAWVLRHVEGEKIERVAELCGCSLATAKRRIAAAHAVLYAELEDG